MSIRTIAAAVSAFAFATSAIAGTPVSQSVGLVKSGHALIAREGRLIQADAGTKLLSGDRVLTRQNLGAKLQMADGCSMTVPQASIVSVSSGGCDAVATGFAPSSGKLGGAGSQAALSGGTLLVAIAALGAAGAGIWAAADSGNNGAPASP